MDQKEYQRIFELTVEQAEQDAYQNLKVYRLKLFLFILLAYACIFTILLASVFGVALLVHVLHFSPIFWLLCIPSIVVAIKLLWIKTPEPKGYQINVKKFPHFHRLIRDFRRELKTPPIHRVIITPELNAAILQSPRLGIFGWNKNTLFLGLELLLVLSPQQAKAVLAHEFGHLSGNHSRFNGWIYRVRNSLNNIFDKIANSDNAVDNLFKTFFYWYIPRFNAYSFVLARMNEYEADAISVEMTDKFTSGEALMNVYVSSPYVDEIYWERFFKQADKFIQPQHLPWAGLSRFLRANEPAKAELAERLTKELEKQTNYSDTHPCLRDRLSNLSVKPVIPNPSERSAARDWFGKGLEKMIADFDNSWLEHNQAKWKERYMYVRQSNVKLVKLRELENSTLKDERLLEKAQLNEEFGRREHAIEAYRCMQKRRPEDPSIAYRLGRLLFENNNDEILAQMLIAINGSDVAVSACEYAYQYLHKTDRPDQAKWWQERAYIQAQIDREAELELSRLSPDDKLVQPKLEGHKLEELRTKLEFVKKFKGIWVAEKVLKHYSPNPALVVAVEVRGLTRNIENIIRKTDNILQNESVAFIVPRIEDYEMLVNKIIRNGIKIV